MSSDAGFYAPDPMPRWRRWLQQRLFPQTYLQPAGDDDNPAWVPGEVYTGVVVQMCWKDRLRALVSGLVELEVRHRMDVHVSRVSSRSQFNVKPPTWLVG